LVHREQDDPKIHDASSSSIIFQELAPSQARKIKNRNDLENELFGSSGVPDGALLALRDNEGEAAEHGIYFDDTEYDYMQHVRDLNSGNGNGQSVFLEAAAKREGKGKGKMSLEDALRESSLHDGQSDDGGSSHIMRSSIIEDDLLPSKYLRKGTYQDQQDVPDVLAGFQPDMDPRLREVLEALDDEAYVDDEEEIFGEIAKGGQEVSLDEFGDTGFEEDRTDEAGWETDETEKPFEEYRTGDMQPLPIPLDTDTEMGYGPDHGDGDWMKEFNTFKQVEKTRRPIPEFPNTENTSSIVTGTSINGGRRKKRKGAMTSSTGYSMTSSSLFRTEGLTLLDARFDKIEEDYAEDEMDMDDGTASVITRSSVASSQAPSLTTRSDFDGIMDDFLGSYSMSGKKRVKKGGYQSGIEQLDEVRKGLGPARFRAQKA